MNRTNEPKVIERREASDKKKKMGRPINNGKRETLMRELLPSRLKRDIALVSSP